MRLSLCLAMGMLACCMVPVMAEEKPEAPVIVLAAFGTSEPDALPAILNIVDRVTDAFPGHDVRLAFTSNIIRGIWHKRADDAEFRAENPDIPEFVYGVGNVLSVLAAVQEDGPRPILVQSLHVTDGTEYYDTAALVKALAAFRPANAAKAPFPAIQMGEPALRVGDGVDAALNRAVEALAPLARKAWDSGSALVLMGHGNEHLNQTVFAKLQQAMRDKFGPHVYIGTVEAEPLGEDVVEAMNGMADAPRKVFLAPLMVVAGDHARNDMAGDDEDSWASLFTAAGYSVECHLEGLGSLNTWADIYVEHLKEAEKRLQAK